MDALIASALAEDRADEDLTARATIAADQSGRAVLSAKADGVISGAGVAARVFAVVDARIEQYWRKHDGDAVAAGAVVAELVGPLRSLLSAERTALNFLQHLSGIATATHALAKLLHGTHCVIADTRKTTPGLRKLEKQAVRHGGGVNHRMDLREGMLIKENHIAAAGSIAAAIAACRRVQGECGEDAPAWVEVECETLDEVREAVAAGPDIILLDNMPVEMARRARALVPAGILLEASGNIGARNAADYAAIGVDRLAVGAITHSAGVLDMSLRVCADDAPAPKDAG